MTWFTMSDLGALLPLIVLALGAFAVLLADAFLKGTRGNHALPYVSLGTLVMTALAALATWAPQRVAAGESLALGPFAVFFALLILGSAAIAMLYSVDYARRAGFEYGEYFGLLLLSTAGMLYLVAANDLVSLFIAFELMSLSVYALVGVARTDRQGGEGAMKYFVLGSFSSAFLLYGLALLYGSSGTIYFDKMAFAASESGPTGIGLAGAALLIVGFGFKVGAVPFHSWIPDAYQGAPAGVTGFMAVAVKAAAFGAFLRVLHATGLLAASTHAAGTAADVLWVLAVLTMVVGNFAAIAQKNMQRLLAYSGIAHSGYVLVGLVAATRDPSAAAGALFYLVGYAAMTIGAFAVLTVLKRDGRPIEDVDDLAGLAAERPGAAFAMTIFMVSLIGIPPLVGFMGKLWIFRAAVAAGFTGLVVIAVTTTAVSVYYYLRVVVVMYMGEPSTAAAGAGSASGTIPALAAGAERPGQPATFGGSLAIGLAVAATILFGLFPSGALEQATTSVKALLERPLDRPLDR